MTKISFFGKDDHEKRIIFHWGSAPLEDSSHLHLIEIPATPRFYRLMCFEGGRKMREEDGCIFLKN